MEKAGPITSGPITTGTSVNRDSTARVNGRVTAVYIEAEVGCLADFTVTITTKEQAHTILKKVNPTTGWYYPRTIIHKNTDGSAIANLYSLDVPIDDFVNVKLEDGEIGDEVKVTLMLE